MKKMSYFICLASIFLAGAASAQDFSDLSQDFSDLSQDFPDLSQDRYSCANIQYTYHVPEFKDTKAPSGYRPFYVSHYGRHGSRYRLDANSYSRIIPQLDSLHGKGLLTSAGEDMRNIIIWMRDEQNGVDGILTQVGSREHQGIGKRLYEHYPQIFRQSDRQVAVSIASNAQRCIQSMANFCLSLKSKAPGLDIRMYTGQKYYMLLANPVDRSGLLRMVNAVTDSLIHELIDPEATGKKFFKDVKGAADVIKGQDIPTLIYNMFEVSSAVKCFDFDAPDPLRHFSDDELKDLSRIFNVDNCCLYSNSFEGVDLPAEISGKPILNDIIGKADAAIAGNDVCADLRFGHDSGLGPLLALIGVEGYDHYPRLADSYRIWPAWKYLPMGSNLQMIFYRNGKGDVLVKLLRNEEETTIPAVPSFRGPYYRWSDLRAYFTAKLKD